MDSLGNATDFGDIGAARSGLAGAGDFQQDVFGQVDSFWFC